MQVSRDIALDRRPPVRTLVGTTFTDHTVREAIAGTLSGVNLDDATAIGEGWRAVAYRVPGENGDWVIRIPKTADAAAETERQTCWYRVAHRIGLPVPRDPRVVRDRAGRNVAGVYRYVAGRPARRGSKDAIRGVAAFLSRLHGADPAQVGTCAASVVDLWRDRYAPLIARYGPTLGRASAAWLQDRADRLERASKTAPAPVAVHGDLQPSHVLTAIDGRIAGVLDPSGPEVTDPALDVARLIQFFSPPFARGVLRQYTRPVDPNFFERARLYAELNCILLLDAEEQGIVGPAPINARRRIASRAAAASRRTNTRRETVRDPELD